MHCEAVAMVCDVFPTCFLLYGGVYRKAGRRMDILGLES